MQDTILRRAGYHGHTGFFWQGQTCDALRMACYQGSLTAALNVNVPASISKYVEQGMRTVLARREQCSTSVPLAIKRWSHGSLAGRQRGSTEHATSS